jgi:methylthioribose-1-phosphate isomerase
MYTRSVVGNKIGTYLKALAAKDNNIPFYVAIPSSTFDLQILDGVHEIPIEERDDEEITKIYGMMNTDSNCSSPLIGSVDVYPKGSPVKNYAFDVTPARLVTGLITERGVCDANEKSIMAILGDQQ